MKKEMNKNGIALPFNWLFAIIAGIIILFIAIYATAKFITTSEYRIYTETSAKLTVLLEPMGTGLASGKSAQINFKKETRTYYGCSDLGTWGKNTIAFSEKTFSGWGEKGGGINTQKYVFAENMIEGKQLNLFSKPFEMPFKIDDIIVISGKNYCFYDAPNEIKDEVQGLNINNIYFAEDINDKNCTGIKVCFGSGNCEIKIFGLCEGYNCESKYDYGKVFKEGRVLYYDDGLIYSAIVSSPEIYECNLKRLMKKFNELSLVYIDKNKIIGLKGCGLDVEADLIGMMGSAKALNSSEDLYLLSQKADDINAKNNVAICKLY